MAFSTELMLFITIITPIATAVTEALKQSIKVIPKQYYSLLTIVVAIIVAAIATPFTDLDTAHRLWGGLIAGLASAKLYDFTIDKMKSKG